MNKSEHVSIVGPASTIIKDFPFVIPGQEIKGIDRANHVLINFIFTQYKQDNRTGVYLSRLPLFSVSHREYGVLAGNPKEKSENEINNENEL